MQKGPLFETAGDDSARAGAAVRVRSRGARGDMRQVFED